ncbi:hypothetical protein [Aeoliella sp. SH292]|uniref:hypothetical protein n=1 Tax=Aeoliella sp. SH292 TaxID=3454464 RepID=UPI003F9C3A70
MLLRVAKLSALVLLSWCVMTTTHELGHLVTGWLGGGTLVDVELRPWKLPHSRFAPDPYPRLTLWGGPVLGVALPVLLAWAIDRQWAWFVANFCVLANGLYILLAWYSGDRWLDTPRLIAEGESLLVIAIFAALATSAGYYGMRGSVNSIWKPPASHQSATHRE